MTKPRVRITADGWIRHDGSGMPVPGKTMVETRHACGESGVARAEFLAAGYDWWARKARFPEFNIVAYRIISMGEA